MSEMLKTPLPLVNDREDKYIPRSLPPVIDGHVHLFPDQFLASIWQWFEQFGWPIRYKLRSTAAIEFLLSRGVSHIIGLHYAHKAGVAQELNAYMAELCNLNPQVTGMATIFPGEKDAVRILTDAFGLGLCGVKLHSHVQCFDMHSTAMHAIYELCATYDKPLVMHVGREPKSPAYPCDPYELCSAEKLEKVVKAYPKLRICVPHLGLDEFEAYRLMLEKYDNLWLDTTMTLADYLPINKLPKLSEMRADRIIFGTDFPNLPYAWDREIKRLCKLKLPEETLSKILGQNAVEFYSIKNI